MGIIIVEGIITFITIAALFYVAPGLLSTVKTAAVPSGGMTAEMNTSAAAVSTAGAGGLSVASIILVVMGIVLLVAALMSMRGFGKNK